MFIFILCQKMFPLKSYPVDPLIHAVAVHSFSYLGSTVVLKCYMVNSRYKQFISFKLVTLVAILVWGNLLLPCLGRESSLCSTQMTLFSSYYGCSSHWELMPAIYLSAFSFMLFEHILVSTECSFICSIKWIFSIKAHDLWTF